MKIIRILYFRKSIFFLSCQREFPEFYKCNYNQNKRCQAHPDWEIFFNIFCILALRHRGHIQRGNLHSIIQKMKKYIQPDIFAVVENQSQGNAESSPDKKSIIRKMNCAKNNGSKNDGNPRPFKPSGQNILQAASETNFFENCRQ